MRRVRKARETHPGRPGGEPARRPEPGGQPVPPAGFNIESLTVGHSETPDISRMTIVVDGTDARGSSR